MALQARFVDLPVELLQHIASLCDEVGRLHLRLVCRHLDRAVLDVVAQNSFARLYTSVVDPARLQRLRHVLEHPHLIKYLQEVTLFVSPFEGLTADEFPEPWRRGKHTDDHLMAMIRYNDRRGDAWNRRREGPVARPLRYPDRQVLDAISELLERTTCTKIALELAPILEIGHGLAGISNLTSKAIFSAPLCPNLTHLQLEKLALDGRDIVTFLRPCAPSLTCVHFLWIMLTSENVDWTDIMSCLLSASALEVIRINTVCHLQHQRRARFRSSESDEKQQSSTVTTTFAHSGESRLWVERILRRGITYM